MAINGGSADPETIRIVRDENRDNENQFIKKVKRIAEQMKAGISDTAHIRYAINDFVRDASVAVQNAGSHVTEKKVKGISLGTGNFILKSSIFLLFGYAVLFYGNIVFEFIFNSSLTIMTYLKDILNLNIIAVGWASSFLSLLAIVFILVTAYPSQSSNWKKTIYNWEMGLFLFFLLFLTVWSQFYNEDLGTLDVDKLRIESTASIGVVWDNFWCNFNPECILAKMQTSDVEVAKFEFSIDKSNIPYSTFDSSELETKGLNIQYNVISSGGVNFTKFTCLYKGKEFYSEELEDNLVTGEMSVPYDMECQDLQKIPLSTTSAEAEYSLTVVLEMDVITKFTQQIPVVDFNQYVVSKGYDTTRNVDWWAFLRDDLREDTKDYMASVQSNPAVEFVDRTSKVYFPLLIGDNENKEIPYPIVIKESKSQSFGKFKKAIIESDGIVLPRSLRYLEEPDFLGKEIKFDNEEFSKIIELTENEITLEQPIAAHDLEITVRSTFEYERIVKFKIFNEDFRSNRNDSLTSDEIMQMFEDLISDFEDIQSEFENQMDKQEVENAIKELQLVIDSIQDVIEDNTLTENEKDNEIFEIYEDNYQKYKGIYSRFYQKVYGVTPDENGGDDGDLGDEDLTLSEVKGTLSSLQSNYASLKSKYDDIGEDTTQIDSNIEGLNALALQLTNLDEKSDEMSKSEFQSELNSINIMLDMYKDDYEILADFIN